MPKGREGGETERRPADPFERCCTVTEMDTAAMIVGHAVKVVRTKSVESKRNKANR